MAARTLSPRAVTPGGDEGERTAECRARALALLRRNLSPHGILAATPGPRAESRGYTAIFGRDAAICALGMAVSGDPVLEREAVTGLATVAAYQAPNGQLPKFVDVRRREADFWYLGCIDSTLWWLIALATLDRLQPARGLRRRESRRIALALGWLAAQEHQRFFLLQQNEASDWADIMPRSGFVLYTNALWYHVKQLYGVARAAETARSFNGLLHPYSGRLGEYRRAQLLADPALRGSHDRDLYLSFVNLGGFGGEGDVFGNLLALLLGPAGAKARRRVLDALQRARVATPYPARTVCRPIPRGSALWRPYMARHRQNFAWQYHNGGIWPMVGAFWILALVQAGERREAARSLAALTASCALGRWGFAEWLHGRTLAPRGMRGQSWSAAGWLLAEHAVRTGDVVLRAPRPAAR